MKTIWLDFDGTVVDILPRYYQVLSDYIFPERMRFEDYCKLKRGGNKDHEIIHELTGQDIDVPDYMKYKREYLEKKHYLRMDKRIGNPVMNYTLLKQTGYTVTILTQRNNRKNFESQLGWIQEKQICDGYVVVKPQPGENVKKNFLERHALYGDIVIGDSRMELECAQIDGVRVFIVDTGLISKEYISEHMLSSSAQCFNGYDEVARYLHETGKGENKW